MSKDRRLGRGLAALLGTPLDESGIVDGAASPADAAAAPRRTPGVTGPGVTGPGVSGPGVSGPGVSSAGSIGSEPALAAAGPATSSQHRPQPSPRPRANLASSGPTGVTGSVPLTSVLPAQSPSLSSDLPAPSSPSTRSANASAAASGAVAESSTALEIDVQLIDANPFQPRRQFNEEEIASLAESIKEHQQLQPVLVRKVGSRYQLISGERRLRATIHAGLTKVRAEVREADDRLVAELAIVENLQRKDLNPIEKALSFRRYLDEHSCTQDELAKRLKIDRSTIANLMRLLELPAAILDDVQNDRLSAGHARALLPLGEEAQQLAMARQIQAESWSVRQTEHAVTDMLAREDGKLDAPAAKGKRGSARTVSPQIGSLEQELRRSLGTKIEIRQSARGRGKIVVHFHSAEEFERIREILVPDGQRSAA